MTENLFFSLGTALPIFLMMTAGWGLKQTGMIDDSFTAKANNLIFYVALPIKLFSDVSHTSFLEAFDATFILFLIGIMVMGFALSVLVGKLVINNTAQLGAFVQGSFRGNFLYIGYSLMENITGTIGPKVPMVAAFVVPAYNILSVLALSLSGSEMNPQNRWRNIWLGILRNPIILGITAGALFSLLPVEMPLFVDRTMGYFSALTMPMALLMIGASFRVTNAMKALPLALLSTSIKLVIFPMAAVLLALSVGYRGEEVVLTFVLYGVPTATTSYIMAVAMKNDHELTASIIMITTALSIITMTAFIFAFRTTGII